MSYTDVTGRFAARTTREKGLAVVLAVLLLVPLATTRYLSFLSAQFLLFAILGLSLGLIWGYGGILSFGHAAFFGLGAYCMAWSYEYLSIGINSGYIGLVAAAIVPSVLAVLLGIFLFYSEVKDVYFVIITLAVAVILEQLATSSGIMFEIFGGFNGLYLPRLSLTIPGLGGVGLNDRMFYVLAVVAIAIAYVGCRRLVRSHFGQVLVAIRENEERTQALGYNTARYKTLVFGFSAGLAGIAGALYATLAGFISPTLLGFALSTEVVIWVAVGGRQYLGGAIVGSVLVNAFSSGLSEAISTRYRLILGLLFVLVVVGFRRGLAGPVVTWLRGGESG
jgi:urea ABC transporter permease protein UrtC